MNIDQNKKWKKLHSMLCDPTFWLTMVKMLIHWLKVTVSLLWFLRSNRPRGQTVRTKDSLPGKRNWPRKEWSPQSLSKVGIVVVLYSTYCVNVYCVQACLILVILVLYSLPEKKKMFYTCIFMIISDKYYIYSWFIILTRAWQYILIDVPVVYMYVHSTLM